MTIMQMMLCNNTSRYDVAVAAVNGGALNNPRVAVDAHVLTSYFRHCAQQDRKYIHGRGEGELPDPAASFFLKKN